LLTTCCEGRSDSSALSPLQATVSLLCAWKRARGCLQRQRTHAWTYATHPRPPFRRSSHSLQALCPPHCADAFPARITAPHALARGPVTPRARAPLHLPSFTLPGPAQRTWTTQHRATAYSRTPAVIARCALTRARARAVSASHAPCTKTRASTAVWERRETRRSLERGG
jgi:hypothetical protein